LPISSSGTAAKSPICWHGPRLEAHDRS
jgi:hypothetical protein